MGRIESSEQLEELRRSLLSEKEAKETKITVCTGTGCRASGAEEVMKAFEREIGKNGFRAEVTTKGTGCHGFCERGPLVVLDPDGIFYQKVKPEDVPEILSETVKNKRIIKRLLYEDPTTGERITHEKDVPFYKKQQRLLLAKSLDLDPTDIGDYIAHGGYGALAKVLGRMTPEEVIREVKKSGLRGRGGGGFPTGVKWETCRNAEGDPKYVICNADEGDPGAYMDRSLLEGNPHGVIEGMIIGAYAIGASEGFIYVRNEYPLAVANARLALEQAREYGFLGEDILSSGFEFDIRISRGGGAFVCGESSALMASLEGKPGRPRAKYIHTVKRGLWGKPSNLNNVETWANVPLIIQKGSEWYREIGTEKSKGTKIFSLVGKINNTGLVEVPMGISLREIIYDIGGGIPDGKRFKAVQTGGPSGGCVPESLIDMPVDFDELTKAGSMMGSGGMVVMDEGTCMVDVARYFLNFLKDESCGKCVPCREGIKRMLEILDRICEGKGEEGDVAVLSEIARAVQDTSLCALGRTAPNPLLTTIKYFRDEYMAHIRDKKCPAGVCKALIRYVIDQERCTGCGACKKACPEGAITGERKNPHEIDPGKCVRCGICIETCKEQAIKVA
ncbi:MAG: 4Fe-4S binding protein [Deltaproteobacteria bacterium]|nr:4Fe-4S binding protein [Deltaproteobacteria bacterium]